MIYLNNRGVYNMKRIIFVLVVLSLLIAGCSQKETAQDSQDIVSPSGPSSVETYEQDTDTDGGVIDDNDLKPSEPKKEIDRNMQAILDKSAKVNSMRYSYQEFIRGTTGYYADVVVKGNKMKHELRIKTGANSGVYKPGEMYDTVYFDLSSGKVSGYCERSSSCDDNYVDTEVDVSDETFVKETPLEVLEDIKYSEFVRSEMVNNKDAKVFERKLDNGNVQVTWVETYRALPVKYDVLDPSDVKVRSVTFENLFINDVKDSELVH